MGLLLLMYNILSPVVYQIVNKGKKEIKIESEGELKPISAGVGEYASDINAKVPFSYLLVH